MEKIIIAIFIVLALLLSACSPNQETCKGSYFEYKSGECCLDANSNDICDSDEKKPVLQEVKEAEQKKQDLEKVRESLDNSSQKSFYKVIRESLSGKCWLLIKNSWKEMKDVSAFDLACSTRQDCIDFFEPFKEEIQEYRPDISLEDALLEDTGASEISCSETKPDEK